MAHLRTRKIATKKEAPFILEENGSFVTIELDPKTGEKAGVEIFVWNEDTVDEIYSMTKQMNKIKAGPPIQYNPIKRFLKSATGSFLRFIHA